MLSVPNDITVSDDHDNISKNQVVIDDDNVDYDGLGLFDIEYTVEDTWGRVGTKKGKINIKSSMDSNVISIYPKSNTTTTRNGDPNSTDNSAFDIKFFRNETENKNYMRGVKLKDDHDNLTKDNVEVTWNPDYTSSEDEEPYNDIIKGVAKVGQNTLHYKVTDSWGRASEYCRTVNLTNAILKNSILFKIGNRKDMARFTFEEVSSGTSTNQIKLNVEHLNTDASSNQITLKVEALNRTEIVAPHGNIDYYTVKITKPNEAPQSASVHSNSPYNDQFDVFNNMKLP